MVNKSPIATQTKVVKVKIDKDLKNNIINQCDTLGGTGYLLRASFPLDNSLVLIFQRTR